MSASYIGKDIAYREHVFTVSSYRTFEGYKLYGFIVTDGPHASRRQSPCWYTQREAIESAHFHLDMW